MSTLALRLSAIFLTPLTLLSLAGCGSNHMTVCAAATTSNCCDSAGDACPAPRFLYAAGISGEISSFQVSGGGALGTAVTIPGPAATLGMAASNNQFLYVSDFQNSQISAWSNAMTGNLSAVPGSPFSLGSLSVAAGLATTNTGFLYVADVGRIDAFQVDASGALTAVPNSPFPSGVNLFLAVDPQDRFVFAPDDAPPGGVSAFTIASATGELTTVPGSPFAALPNAAISQPAAIVVDSTGNFVYTTLLSTSQVAGFAITGSSGALTPIPGSPFTVGNLPIALTTVSNFLYVAADDMLFGFSIDSTTGILTPISGSPFAIPTGAITVNPTGDVLYASGPAGISAYTINPSTGALALITGSPFPSVAATVLTFVQ